MEKDSSLIRKILFNILVVLAILFIYFMFFPKKSYVKAKLNDIKAPQEEEIINQNINSMKIASEKYFDENDKKTVTLEELIKNNLLVDLKDSNNSNCDNTNSYSEIKNNKMYVYLKCSSMEKTIEEDFNNSKEEQKENKKLLCLYQYEKKIDQGYTEWSDWSDWQTEEVLEDEFTNVETKVEEELDGTKIVTDSKEESINATRNTRNVCPSGYHEENNKCIKKTELNTITASISYTCPSGYSRNGTTCYKNGYTTAATKSYYCPTNKNNLEYQLSGSNCRIFNISYKEPTNSETYYTCPSNYKLSGSKCYKTEYYDKEVENYKEITYYRYRTRKKQNEKNIIKWSTPNDNSLLNDEYNMTREIFCEF